MSNIRFTCTCDPLLAQSQKENYTYPRQVVLDLPDWSKAYKRRIDEGHPPNVCIDVCIKDMILKLWEIGIETTGCCCGHNHMAAWVSVDSECYESMFELGYFQKMPEVINDTVMGLYTFYL